MAKKKTAGPSKDDLLNKIRDAVEKAKVSGDGQDSGLQEARDLALKYYNMELPARFRPDSSSFVSSDVFDAIETRKATLLETFTGNVKPVQFSPINPQDSAITEMASTRVDQVVMEECDGYALMQDVIHDGLLNRNGIVQAFYEKQTAHIPFTIAGLTDDTASAYLSQHGANLVSYELEEDDEGTNTLHVVLNQDLSGVRIQVVPAEEFGIASDASDLKDASFTYRRRRIPVSELASMGVPSEEIEELVSSKSYLSDTSPVEIGPKSERMGNTGIYDAEFSDEMERLIEVFECYIVMDTDEGKTTYQALYVNNRVLRYEAVRRHPFHSFTPLKVPHRFWGGDFAGTVIPTQNITTSLTRFALDHGMTAAVPRWMIREGALSNPIEMLEPRMGGVVNINGSLGDAIAPLPTPNLNPALFKLLESMAQEKQQRTGSNDLSGSMLKDVLSNQNSADLVSQMATMGQTRTKIMARNFSAFLAGLYEHVYDLLVENETQPKAIQLTGQWVFVDPSQWNIHRQARVDFHIGYGEREKEAQQLMQFDQYASTQPDLQRLYGETQRYNLLSDMMRLTGRYNVNRYLADPATLPPPQPDQQQQLEASLQQREMAVKEQNANTASMAANAKAQTSIASTQSKAANSQQSSILKQQQQELKVQSFAHQATMDVAELAMQHHAQNIQAIAKPVATTAK